MTGGGGGGVQAHYSVSARGEQKRQVRFLEALQALPCLS